MKQTDKKKPVPTMPQGVWESSHTDQTDEKQRLSRSARQSYVQANAGTHSEPAYCGNSPESPVTDLQGNGYPDAVTEDHDIKAFTGNTDKLSATAKTFLDTHSKHSHD